MTVLPPTTVGEAPVGLLILTDGCLICKTEYRLPNGRAECYIVESGECYHGEGDAAECLPLRIGGDEIIGAIRRKLGLAERNPMPVEGRQQPRAPGGCFEPEAEFRATRTYLAACAGLDRVPGAFDAITDLCDQHQPRDLSALKEGARVLEGFFVRGGKAA